jgi:bifunctional non-homologous end joining protein LigD
LTWTSFISFKTSYLQSTSLLIAVQWHFFLYSLYMPQHKQRTNKTTRSSTDPLRLKRIPSKKAPYKKERKEVSKGNLTLIDIRNDKKDYAGLAQIIKRNFPDAPQSKMPADLKPMLATLVDEAFNDDEWQFELKLDGYRALAYLKSGKADIRSRNNNSFNKQFAQVHDALTQWNINAIVDGEIAVLNEDGRPDFNGIQQWVKKKEGELVYYVFDLLWLDGIDIMSEPLHKRRAALKQLAPDNGIIRFSDHIDGSGKDFYKIVKQNDLEGIIAKQKNAPYIPDSRSRTWLKIKAEQKHEAIICGFTKKHDSDRLFSSLVLGVYEDEKLKFIGQAGTGFTAAVQEDLMKKMRPQMTKKSPFGLEPAISDPVTWLKPFFVCEVKYTEITRDGVMRHASFQGLREDKTANDINKEEEKDTEDVISKAGPEKNAKRVIPANKEEIILNVDGHDLKLTNLKKLYWIKEKITKGSLLEYYYSMADFIMPYMKDRPQSLNRFPNGVNGESFYHKNMAGKVNKWLKTFKRFSDSSGEAKDFLICADTASLLYMANLGCIEMNPWHSRAQSPLYPDWSVVDLDPGDISFEKVIETALVVKKVLDSLNVPSYVKTSGSTGMHIYIPLGAKYNYEQSKQLAELIANLVHDELPSFTSMVRNPEKRKDKIYLDYLQNRPIQTICAPYSVRPKPGATVSAPLHWDEVKRGLKISQFTVKNIGERVKAEGDLFEGVMGKGIDLNGVLKQLSGLI